MIQNIITFLNTELTALAYFKTLHGIAEQVTDNAKTFPAIYDAKGNFSHIKWEANEGYHRLTGDVETESEFDEEAISGNRNTITITYPMRFVWFLQRATAATDGSYGIHTVADAIAKKIFANATTTFNNDLGTEYVTIDISRHDLNQQSVWEKEFDGIDYSLNSKLMVGALDYTVTVVIGEKCWLA